MNYPPWAARPSSYSRQFQGHSIADPWHELEDHANPEVHRWALAQDQVAGDYLHQHTDAAHYERWLRDNTRAVPPVWRRERGDSSFYFRMIAGKEQPVLYRLVDGGAEQCVLDLNGSAEVLHPLLTEVSPSGKFLVYCSAPMGEPMVSWQVMALQTGELIERGYVRTIEPRLAWLPDESGYYYGLCRSLFEAGATPVDGVYLHRLDADSFSQDELVLAYPGDTGQGHIASPYLSQNGRQLVILSAQFSSGNSGLLVADLDCVAESGEYQWIDIIDDASCFNRPVGFCDNLLYLHTCHNAPNGQLVAIDLDCPQVENWRLVVPEQALALAKPEQFISPDKSAVVNSQLYLCYVEDAHDIIRQYALDGTLVQELRPPEFSTIDAVYAIDDETVIYSQSFLRSRAAWRCRDGELELGELELRELELIDALSSACTVTGVEMTQQFYTSADGTRIPLYILQPAEARSAQMASRQPGPTLLYAYGGFGQTIAPEFTAEACLWLANGGSYVLANIRGGGEYGEAWHKAAMAAKRQTAFDDFYAAARYLIDEGFTEPSQLAIKGISNGGLLSSVALNQHPELFAAVITEVPLVDVFYMADSSVGGALSAEYGNPFEDPEVLAAMLAYSPLQNVREHPDNPPQLIVVAEKDPSAQPGQIYKYLAARQALASTDTPVLLRIIYGEGHTHWPWATHCRNLAEQVAFLWHFVGNPGGDK